jgi:hypothetical protein
VFLSFATPDEPTAGALRDELQARELDVWMVNAQVGLGESLVTGIDIGIGASIAASASLHPRHRSGPILA